MKKIYDDFIIGISYGFHDSAVALLQNGKVVNAVEEERFTGIKHDFSFPINSINWILKENKQLNQTVFYLKEKPLGVINKSQLKFYSSNF